MAASLWHRCDSFSLDEVEESIKSHAVNKGIIDDVDRRNELATSANYRFAKDSLLGDDRTLDCGGCRFVRGR